MTATAQILKEWFGVRPAAARIVVALYDAGGALIGKDVLVEASGQTAKGVAKSLKELRQAMDPRSIERRRIGYALTPAGIADCDAGLVEADRRNRRSAA